MKVKQLIARLKAMPQYMDVGVAMGDNEDGEVAGWPISVDIEDEINMGTAGHIDIKMTGRKIVIIHC